MFPGAPSIARPTSLWLLQPAPPGALPCAAQEATVRFLEFLWTACVGSPPWISYEGASAAFYMFVLGGAQALSSAALGALRVSGVAWDGSIQAVAQLAKQVKSLEERKKSNGPHLLLSTSSASIRIMPWSKTSPPRERVDF